jgi:hypothetical protein
MHGEDEHIIKLPSEESVGKISLSRITDSGSLLLKLIFKL